MPPTILDLTYQGGQIRINIEQGTITLNDELVTNYDEFKAALESEIDEIFSQKDYDRVKVVLSKIRDKNSKLYNAIIDALSDVYPHDLDKEFGSDIQAAGLSEDNSNLNPAIQNLIDYMIQNKVQKKIVKLKADSKYDEFIKDAKPAIDQKILRVTLNPIDKNEMWISLGSEAQKLFKEFKNTISTGLNENYSRFKNETKTRGKSDQFHQAVRAVRQKVQEINRLFEYVSRLKQELSEGEGGLKYRMHTEKALAKIKDMVNELNKNVKKFK